jgi:hypothetical protein
MMFYLLLLSSILAFAQNYAGQDCGCEDKPQITVLAVVNGVKITKQDLSIDARTKVSLAQDKVIAARSHALNQHINHHLLEAEAKRRGLTRAQLLELELRSKIVEPTEEEAKAYYEQNKNRGAPDFKNAKKEVLALMRSQRETQRALQFANALRAGAQIQMSELPVTPPRTEADLARVFATVNGVEITSRDIEHGLRSTIYLVQQQVYNIRKEDLDLRINDLLLEHEAKRLETTPKALLDQYVRLRIPIITEDHARAYYEQHKAELKRDFNDLKFSIMQQLHALEEQKLALAYADELRKGAAVQIYLTPPSAPR